MKYILLSLTILLLMTGCSKWIRIADLTMVGNRNIDDSQVYILVSREVESVARADQDALEQAVDKLTEAHQGEFIRNVKIYVKSNGKKVKVVGDVWGMQITSVNVTSEVNEKIYLKAGDDVIFKLKGKFVEEKIIGLNPKVLIVEYDGDKKIELKYDEVTKMTK
jgi:hypothetical protein